MSKNNGLVLSKWKTSEMMGFFYGFTAAVMLESVAVHYLARVWLLPRTSLMVAVVHFLLSLALLYWLFVQPARRPHIITGNELILRYGTIASAVIPLSDIVSMEATDMISSEGFGASAFGNDKKTGAMFMTTGKSNKFLLQLEQPVKARGIKTYQFASQFVFNLDEPELLKERLEESGTADNAAHEQVQPVPPSPILHAVPNTFRANGVKVLPMDGRVSSFCLQNLSKMFGPLAALQNINLEIYPGEIFGLLGPNGAGKTTLLKTVTGLLQPSSGMVTVRQEQVAYMPEYLMLYERLSGREFLNFLGTLYDLPAETMERDIESYLARFDLRAAADRPMGSYSQGMKRKISLIGTLLKNSPIVLLDEPTNGLDPTGIIQVKDLMRELTDRGRTVLISTHILDMVERLCDRVGILAGGRLLFVGTLEELRNLTGMGEASLESIFLRLVQEEREWAV
ncbi:MAG: ABC transporter ATP-binding protein [Syntrophomonadaceae bacterium]